MMMVSLRPLTPKFDTATYGHCLKSTCDMGPINRREIINDMTCDIGLFLNRHGILLNSDTGHGNFLNSTCDIRDPPSRAPSLHGKVLLNHDITMMVIPLQAY